MSNMISDVVAAATAILCENNNDDEASTVCTTMSPTQDKPIDLHRNFAEIDACVNQSCLNAALKSSTVKEEYLKRNNFPEINVGPVNGVVGCMSAKSQEEAAADKRNGEKSKERQSLKCSRHTLKRKADRNNCPQESKHPAFSQTSSCQPPSERHFRHNKSEFVPESFGQVTSDGSYNNNVVYEVQDNESATMTRTSESQSYAVGIPQHSRLLPCTNNFHATSANNVFPGAPTLPAQYPNSPPQSSNSSPNKNGQKTVATSKFVQSKTVTTTKNFKQFNAAAQSLQGPKTIVVGNQIIQLPPNSQILSKSTVLTGQSQIFNSQPFPGSSAQMIPKVSQIVQSGQVMRPTHQYFASPLSYQVVQSQPHIFTAQTNFPQSPIQLVPIPQGLNFQQHPIIINSHQGTSTTFLAQDTSFVVQQPPQVELSALPAPTTAQQKSQSSNSSTGSTNEIIIDDSEKAVSLTNSPGEDASCTQQALQPSDSGIQAATTPSVSQQHHEETASTADLNLSVSKTEPKSDPNTVLSAGNTHEKEHKSRRGRPRLYERDPDTNKPIKTKRLPVQDAHDDNPERDIITHSSSSANDEDNASDVSADLHNSTCLNELNNTQNVNGARKYRAGKSQNGKTSDALKSENQASFTEDESLPLSAFSKLRKSRSSNSGPTKESSDRNVMTHIVEGFIIRESLEPFPNLQKIDERDAHQKKQRSTRKSVLNAATKEKDGHLLQNDEKENKKKSKVETKQCNLNESANKADEKPVTSSDSKRLKEDPESWTIDEVSQFVLELSNNVDLAESFRNHEVDGRALFLVKEEFLMQYMNMKLGPALKLCSRIAELKKQTIMNQMPTIGQL